MAPASILKQSPLERRLETIAALRLHYPAASQPEPCDGYLRSAMFSVADAAVLLRDARLRAGLSQVELGRRAGVTQSVVSAYELRGCSVLASTACRSTAMSLLVTS